MRQLGGQAMVRGRLLANLVILAILVSACAEPTPTPTAEPTPSPTATATPSPTPTPTAAPSPTPTATPTAVPRALGAGEPEPNPLDIYVEITVLGERLAIVGPGSVDNPVLVSVYRQDTEAFSFSLENRSADDVRFMFYLEPIPEVSIWMEGGVYEHIITAQQTRAFNWFVSAQPQAALGKVTAKITVGPPPQPTPTP